MYVGMNFSNALRGIYNEVLVLLPFRGVLFQHFESAEEGTRNVVAECVGKLTLVDPEALLPKLRVTTTN